MTRVRARRLVTLSVALAASLGAARARAEIDLQGHSEPVRDRFKSPRHFAFELRFGPYRPDVDSEFSNGNTPYNDFFGSGSKLLSQLEVDYELLHTFGTVAVGVSAGYFSVTGQSPVADGSGMLSGDFSTFKVLPFAVSAIYRFDYFLERRGFPLVPYGKLGLDWAYWQITDANDTIATFGSDIGRGGTWGWHAGVGLALVLDFFDPEAARDFDADLGVNHTALIGELTHADISGLGQADQIHLGDTTWSLGILIQF